MPQLLASLAALGAACIVAAIVGGKVQVMEWLQIDQELKGIRQWGLGIFGIGLIGPLVVSLALGVSHQSRPAEKRSQAPHPTTETPSSGNNVISRRTQKGAEPSQEKVEVEQPTPEAPKVQLHTATSAQSQAQSQNAPHRVIRKGTATPMTPSSASPTPSPAAASGGASASQGPPPAPQSEIPRITQVRFGESQTEPEVTIEGTGLGAMPVASEEIALIHYEGADYGNSLYLCDTSSNPQTFCAGQDDGGGHGWDTVGLIVNPYGETSVSLKLGSSYAGYYFPHKIYELQQGDGFAIHVKSATCIGSVSYGQSIACQ